MLHCASIARTVNVQRAHARAFRAYKGWTGTVTALCALRKPFIHCRDTQSAGKALACAGYFSIIVLRLPAHRLEHPPISKWQTCQLPHCTGSKAPKPKPADPVPSLLSKAGLSQRAQLVLQFHLHLLPPCEFSFPRLPRGQCYSRLIANKFEASTAALALLAPGLSKLDQAVYIWGGDVARQCTLLQGTIDISRFKVLALAQHPLMCCSLSRWQCVTCTMSHRRLRVRTLCIEIDTRCILVWWQHAVA